MAINDTEPTNQELERLAREAEAEDASAEADSQGELQTAADQQAGRAEAARKAAEAIVGGIAKGQRWLFSVDMDKKTKAEGVEVLQEFEQEMPDWLTTWVGRWGKFFALGFWGLGVVMFTMQEIRARQEAEQDQKQPNHEPARQPSVEPEEPREFGGRYMIGGSE